MTDTTKFFEALAERAYRENDLSDVTYAMCEASRAFKQFFLDFFFGRGTLDASTATINREYSEAWGRPDFLIRAGDVTYIVEVKIWDGNHHFEQYFNILSGKLPDEGADANEEENRKIWNRLGYIANYDTIKDVPVKTSDGEIVEASKLCHVATWKEFVAEFEKYDGLNDPMIRAYVGYVRNVCPFDDFKLQLWVEGERQKAAPFDFTMIRDVLNGIKDAIKLAQEAFKDLDFKGFTRSSRKFISQYRAGSFFEFNVADRQRVWGWLGVYYRDKGGVLCVEFEDRQGWGSPVCDKFRDKVKAGCLRFFLKQEELTGTIEETIRVFLNQVISYVVNLGGGDKIVWTYQEEEAKRFQPLLVMKAFPMMLEQNLFGGEPIKIGDSKYEFSRADGNDEEVPESHCGRYFSLTSLMGNPKDSTNEDSTNRDSAERQKPSVKGWVGWMYSSTNKDGEKKPYSENPRIVIEIDKDFANAKLKNSQRSNGWYDNSWGWKCYDVRDNRNVVKEIINGLRSLSSNQG